MNNNIFFETVNNSLNDVNNKDNQCILYFGNFKGYLGNNTVNKETYAHILNICRSRYKKCKVMNTKEYYHKNMVISIDQKKKEFYRVENKNNMITSENMCFFVKTKESLDLNKFPIVNKYNCIKKKNTTTFNNMPFIVSLINEKVNNDRELYSISISFYNKSSNKQWLVSELVSICNFILQEISLTNQKELQRSVHK